MCEWLTCGVFYLHGLMGMVWFLVWLRVGRERPATSHRCSAAERKYIEDALLVELERLRRLHDGGGG